MGACVRCRRQRAKWLSALVHNASITRCCSSARRHDDTEPKPLVQTTHARARDYRDLEQSPRTRRGDALPWRRRQQTGYAHVLRTSSVNELIADRRCNARIEVLNVGIVFFWFCIQVIDLNHMHHMNCGSHELCDATACVTDCKINCIINSLIIHCHAHAIARTSLNRRNSDRRIIDWIGDCLII